MIWANDAAESSQIGIKYELQKDLCPGRVGKKIVIIFRGNFPDFGKPRPGNHHKIVMFIMITHVETQFIQGAVIGVGFLPLFKNIMLLNPSSAKRMQSNAKHAG